MLSVCGCAKPLEKKEKKEKFAKLDNCKNVLCEAQPQHKGFFCDYKNKNNTSTLLINE